ncbi:MAG: SRPBCC domain-containing protein [Williamsia sp.]|nr:SRPBCC domain-containing protein [Williamsia sp.]
MDNQPIVIERLFNAPASLLWKALTNKDEMKNWYFNLAEFKAEPGFRFQFSGGPSPEKQYTHLCEVTEVVPEKKLAYSWRYEGYPGISYVSFELAPQGDKTLLTLTHTGLASFPHDNPDFDASNFIKGWNGIINKSLAAYIEKAESASHPVAGATR